MDSSSSYIYAWKTVIVVVFKLSWFSESAPRQVNLQIICFIIVFLNPNVFGGFLLRVKIGKDPPLS